MPCARGGRTRRHPPRDRRARLRDAASRRRGRDRRDPGGGDPLLPAELESLLSTRTRLVILNAPENPTGGVTSQADLERAAAAITQTPAWVLTDEVYSRITYDVEAPSIASLPGLLERTVLLDGFSKTFAMTGWRLGYAAVPTELVDPLTRLIVNSTSYAFPNVLELPIGADELADRLLDEVGVAVLSGTSFGGYGDGHLRISYASSLTNLEQAVERIRHFAAAL